MRPCSAALISFLASEREAAIVDLYTFVLVTGEVFRFCGGNTSVGIPGPNFPTQSINYDASSSTIRTFTLGPKFDRTKVKDKIGLSSVSDLEVDILANEDDRVGTFSLANAFQLGLFDGAILELDRFFVPAPEPGDFGYDTSLGCMVWFYGRVADTVAGRSKIIVTVKAMISWISTVQLPRRIYQASCNLDFGGESCGYDRELGKNALGVSTGIGAVTIAAASGSTQQLLVTGFAPTPSDIYNLGTVQALSGPNTGFTRTISQVVAGTVYLANPFLYPVEVGDTFKAKPGCNHVATRCNTNFLNFLRWGGFFAIPPPEAAA